MISFIDFSKIHNEIKNEIDAVIQNVINENAFVFGRYLQEFENNFANKLGVKHCIGVNNGTDAIAIALKAAGIKPGDEVITSANSFVATAGAIVQIGAKPVFVDHDEYYGIDTSLIEKAITERTKAVIPVHLYGQACNISEVVNICKKHKLLLIEDAAQSHFSKYKNQFTGTFGDAACYSFYPSKNLGAFGDGGAIVTNNDNLANKIRLYINHGSTQKYKHIEIGINSRLDGLQAAILNVKLKYIDKWNKQRLEAALLYNQLLKDCDLIEVPKIREQATHIFHLYVIKCHKRDQLQGYLKSKNIQTGIHYPEAIPFLTAYKYLNYNPKMLPISYENQSKILSLPISPGIREENIRLVVESVKHFYNDLK